MVIAREAGLVDDVEVCLTERRAHQQVDEWAEGMDRVDDPDVGAVIYYDDDQTDWMFEVWEKDVME